MTKPTKQKETTETKETEINLSVWRARYIEHLIPGDDELECESVVLATDFSDATEKVLEQRCEKVVSTKPKRTVGWIEFLSVKHECDIDIY